MTELHIGMVGYGEVGRTFCAGLRPLLTGVAAWDLRFAAAATRARAGVGRRVEGKCAASVAVAAAA